MDPIPSGLLPGPEGIKQAIDWYKQAYPDYATAPA